MYSFADFSVAALKTFDLSLDPYVVTNASLELKIEYRWYRCHKGTNRKRSLSKVENFRLGRSWYHCALRANLEILSMNVVFVRCVQLLTVSSTPLQRLRLGQLELRCSRCR